MQNQPLFQGINIPNGIYARIIRDINYLQIKYPDQYIILLEYLFPDYDDYQEYLVNHPYYNVPKINVPDIPSLSLDVSLITLEPMNTNTKLTAPENILIGGMGENV